LRLLRQQMEALWAHTAGATLFPHPPVLASRPTRETCPHCGAKLKVYKTRPRSVVTLHIGAWGIQETLLHCNQCPAGTVYSSEALAQLVPPRCSFGYDVLVYVGQALFQRYRTSLEVRQELAARNVSISTSEIHHLGRMFIIYLAIAHRQRAPHIRQAMEHNGGYLLHLDGTCEGASPMLMAGLDSITEIVLGSVKAPTERAEYITPFLLQIQNRYGDPVATVRDMGQGIGKAIQEVFPHAKDFICHFHFLRDIGKDLLGGDYDTIRKRLRNYGVRAKLGRHTRALQTTFEQNPALLDLLPLASEPASVPDALLQHTPAVCAYALIQWTLAGLHHGDGYGFPFDRPHLELAKRLSLLQQKLQALRDLSLRGQWRDNDPFRKTLAAIGPLLDDSSLCKAIARIERNIQVFDALRDAMRLAPKHGSQGLNDSGQQENMQTIEAGVTHFRHWLTTHPACANDPDYTNLLGQLDQYWEKLFADPILVNTPAGPVQIQPQRTNNVMERFFRREKQGNRRRTGNIRMGKIIQTMLADTPLVKNLDNPRYMEILLEEHQTLEDLFADIDHNGARTRLLEAQKRVDKVPAKIQQLIAESEFPETIHTGFSKLYQTLTGGPDSNRSLGQ
jgi:hypothetical protein